MREQRNPNDGMTSSATPKSKPPPPPTPPSTTLSQSSKKKSKPKVFRVVRSVFRSFPVIPTSSFRFSFPSGILVDNRRGDCSSNHVTGTLFGYQKGLVSLSIQDDPGTLPMLILELDLETTTLHREMSRGLVRIALECQKRPVEEKIKLVDEPSWAMYCNGKKGGNGVKREATMEDLAVMEMLRLVSMGAGVLQGRSDLEGPEGEMIYVRAHFDRVVGGKDSETLYMLKPDRNNGPELSIFFVRV